MPYQRKVFQDSEIQQARRQSLSKACTALANTNPTSSRQPQNQELVTLYPKFQKSTAEASQATKASKTDRTAGKSSTFRFLSGAQANTASYSKEKTSLHPAPTTPKQGSTPSADLDPSPPLPPEVKRQKQKTIPNSFLHYRLRERQRELELNPLIQSSQHPRKPLAHFVDVIHLEESQVDQNMRMNSAVKRGGQ